MIKIENTYTYISFEYAFTLKIALYIYTFPSGDGKFTYKF